MTPHDFYEDRRFCADCQDYVHYLLSLTAAYCVRCGGRVRILSGVDLERLRRELPGEPRVAGGGRFSTGS